MTGKPLGNLDTASGLLQLYGAVPMLCEKVAQSYPADVLAHSLAAPPYTLCTYKAFTTPPSRAFPDIGHNPTVLFQHGFLQHFP